MRVRAICAVVLVLGLAGQARGQEWTLLGIEGAAETHLRGVSGGSVVGYYLSDDYSQSLGFVYDGASLTAVGFPGSEWWTVPTAIDGQTIVGSYAGGHGFLYDGQSTWTTLDAPWADAGTLPAGVSGGRVAGSYYSAGGDANYEHLYGFLYVSGSWTQINHPGATDTIISGISGSKIVGAYADATGVDYGFVYDADASTWTDVAPPDAASSNVTGLSAGNTVGFFVAQGEGGLDYAHGFLFDGATWTTLDAAADGQTWVYGIDGSTAVGDFTDATGAYGFIVTGLPAAVPEPSTLVLITTGCAVCVFRKKESRARGRKKTDTVIAK